MKIDLDADMGSVLKLYGATMLQLQGFEVVLASVAEVIRHEPKAGRPMTPERMGAILTKSMRRRWHVYRKASASEHLRGDGSGRRDISDELPEGLADRINDLIHVRNDLAHRFLRQRVLRGADGEPRFKPGTLLRLLEIGREANALMRELDEHRKTVIAGWPEPTPPPPEIAQWITEYSRWIVNGEIPESAMKHLRPDG